MLGRGDGKGPCCWAVGVVLIGEDRRTAPGDEAACIANGRVLGLGDVEEPAPAAAAALALGDVSSTSEGLSESENVPTTWKERKKEKSGIERENERTGINMGGVHAKGGDVRCEVHNA